MGTKLILKKADFSENAIIKSLFVEDSSMINLVSTDGCGYRNNTATAVKNHQRLSAYADSSYKPILIKDGETVRIKGLKGVDGQSTVLRLDYAYYSDNTAISIETSGVNPKLVGTASNFVVSDFFPLNAEGTNDYADFQNTYGHDYYFAFSFRAVANNTALTVGNYNIMLEWFA